MLTNRSPWLHQLNRTREAVPLSAPEETEVLIVGGGIAGIVTAYCTLRYTNKNIVLLEADKVAHGATGHNAGQITSYFERPFTELVATFGLPMAVAGQTSIEGAWTLLDAIVAETKIPIPIYRFMGYAGCTALTQVMAHLEDSKQRAAGALPLETLLISESWPERAAIPDVYAALYTVVPAQHVLDVLETDNGSYIAALGFQKGCMNSALFSELLVQYLLEHYSDRFTLYEHTPVTVLTLMESCVMAETPGGMVTASSVVLCTNGFENFRIENTVGEDIDSRFHHTVLGRIGYMAGFIETSDAPPTACSYFSSAQESQADPTGDAYFYLTRRPHGEAAGQQLLCVGGPDTVLPNQAIYERDAHGRDDIQETLDEFLRDTYRPFPHEDVEYAFTWHGLMGFTPNGVRRIGYEPKHPRLLYNLGCNGVGILPSIYGGKRIAQLLAGEVLPPSMFDPR